MKTKDKVVVYYDGLCKVCSREIEHYKHQRGSDQIDFRDICGAGFDAASEGLDPHQVHKIMHVRRSDGTLATRVDAFIEIWKTLPKYSFLAKAASKPGIKQGLEIAYSCFAALRPLLPRYAKPDDCKESPYCEVKPS